MAVLIVVALPAGSASAARPGHLDPRFGTGGVVTTELGRLVPEQGAAGGALLEPDGKIVIVGSAPLLDSYPNFFGGDGDFLVARYNPDGSLDPSFGGGGVVTTDLTAASGYAAALQPDGKLVVAGQSFAGSADAATIVRYNGDGSIDPSFGNGGVVTTPLPDGAPARSVALQPDGKIVVGAEGGAAFGQRLLVVARYDPTGALDPSFGSGGIATTTLGAAEGSYEPGGRVLLQPDGRIVAVGTSPDGLALARYNPDGSPDTTFGPDGKATTSFGHTLGGVDAVLQPDGKIVALANLGAGVGEGLARYLADGSLDPSFGSGGTTTSEAIYSPRTLARQADGKLVVAGDNGGSDQFQLARFNGDGTLDSGFGSRGVTSAGFDSAHPSGRVVAVVPDPSGRLVAMGSAYYEQSVKGHNYSSELALARFDPSGSLDPSFGTGGKVTTSDFGTASVPAVASVHLIATGRDGRFVVAGDTRHGWLLAAYAANGERDPSFGGGGTVAVGSVRRLLVDPHGRIVAVTKQGGVARYTAEGAPDRRFGKAGVAPHLLDEASGGVREASGKIVIAGSRGHRIEVARYLSTGKPDRSFGERGRVILHSKGVFNAQGVVAERSGRIVVAGGKRMLVGIRPHGRIDRTFGRRGFVSVPVGPTAVPPGVVPSKLDGILRTRGGKLVAFGERFIARNQPHRVSLFRFRADGAPDRSFGHRGHVVVFKPANVKLRLNPWGAAVQRDGKVVLGINFNGNVGVVRLNRDGSPDRSFGHHGRTVSPIFGQANAVTVAPSDRILVAGAQLSDVGGFTSHFLIAGFVG